MRTLRFSCLALVACGSADEASPVADPGQVVAHRLNRAEYNNTVRDLFATDLRPADDFPADDFGAGFSNNAETLSISATHLDLYELAADALLAEISFGRTAPSSTVLSEAEDAAGAGVPFGTTRNLWEAGEVVFTVDLPASGWWTVALTGTAEAGTPVDLVVDGALLASTDLGGGPVSGGLELTAGTHTATVALAEPGEPGAAGAPLAVLDAVVFTGPIGEELPPGPQRASIFTCDPASDSPPISEVACAAEIVRAFGRRAWRRPLTDAEVDRLLGLYGTAFGAGAAWDESVMLALKGILLAPWFVYRIEVDPDPESSVPRPLDGYELASRLSYFLWSTMPDEELLTLAGAGLLADPNILRAQVARMLRDPKAGALVETLGAEWLYLTVVDESSPDPVLYPAFDESLRASMKEELMLFAGSILLGDRSMMDLVEGTETWIDARLASHYEVAPPATAGFARVDLADRPGLVSRAGWLTALSHPTRTSPVRRGKWVVENLMCEPPPPVPDNVDQLLEGDDDPAVTTSVRDQLEQHREPSACAQCHVVMDGIGFGLENYDAIGRYRTEDAFGNPLDTAGALVSGATFDDAAGLGAALAADPKTARCMVQKVFTFALGRAPRVEDLDLLAGITEAFERDGHRFSALATEIVLSDAFRYRTPSEVAR